MTFDKFNLHPQVLKAVAEVGYSEPTQIQSQAIPNVLQGLDIRASAQTGTGKTAAFLLPALHRLTLPATRPGRGGPRVLILVPTRELAMQVAVQAEKYSKYLHRLQTVCVVGGVPYPTQMRKLSRPYDILIATPGRLIDFIDRGKIDFSRLEMLVLDEADRMLDMGFVEPVEQIVARTPANRQTLLFSATLKGEVIKLSDRLLNKPMDIMIQAEQTTNENVQQKLYYVDDLYHKNRLLDHLLSEGGVDNAIVFTSTKRHADQLTDELHEKGYRVASLHGDMSQRHRTRTIGELRKGKISILVATDVAARGIDVRSITHVINFDLPRNVEDYVHRIGRTGRAGASGIALSFAAGRDALLVKKIEEFTRQSIDIAEIAGMEPRIKPHTTRPRPSSNRRSRFRPGAKNGAHRPTRSGSKSSKAGAGGSRRNSKSVRPSS